MPTVWPPSCFEARTDAFNDMAGERCGVTYRKNVPDALMLSLGFVSVSVRLRAYGYLSPVLVASERGGLISVRVTGRSDSLGFGTRV